MSVRLSFGQIINIPFCQKFDSEARRSRRKISGVEAICNPFISPNVFSRFDESDLRKTDNEKREQDRNRFYSSAAEKTLEENLILIMKDAA